MWLLSIYRLWCFFHLFQTFWYLILLCKDLAVTVSELIISLQQVVSDFTKKKKKCECMRRDVAFVNVPLKPFKAYGLSDMKLQHHF